jgi:hypothetical protein
MTTSDYCTQMAPDGTGGMRCGPACCASVLLSEGYESDPWQLTLQLDALVDPDKDGTTSQDLLTLMAGYGFGGGMWWTWEEAGENLRAGHAVLLLNDNRYLLPRPYPSSSSFNAMHWIRLVYGSVPDQMVYTYDPLTWMVQPDGTVYQGPTVHTAESCMAAGLATGYPEYGIYLISPSGKDLNVRA